jgi:long-chain acyl-CoA synthetase
MTHPFVFARTHPHKPAVIMAETGEAISYRELEARADRNAHLLRSLGLRSGDCIAAMLENGVPIFEIAWAADRAGLYFTAVSTRLTMPEVEYIVGDSGAKAFFTSSGLGPITGELATRLGNVPLFMPEPGQPPYRDWREEAAAFSATPIEDETAGGMMLYSSGTTGRPKGVKRALSGASIVAPVSPLLTQVYGATSASVYLCPAPLYHAAPLAWSMMSQRLGCTVVVMEKFDAETVLAAIEKYKVTIAQFVPTHFVRLLKLPDDVRRKYDLSSLKTVFHAAAPCPIPVKQAMMDWWGPIIHEYYAGTEANGVTVIGPEEWLRKPGSVGKAMGCVVHACDENGDPLPANTEGQIYFAGGNSFEYHNDQEKTAQSRNRHGWSTLGDVGRVDGDGFLFLTDRKSFMIISGGVNVYPQEIENLLVTHPKVADVAVIGAPDDDLGERVVAVVQPAEGVTPDAALVEELRAFCRTQLSGVKVPKQFDFTAELPRHPTGKLYKRLLRDQYWAKQPQ